MSKLFARFAKDESGATAIEYGLIAAIMAVALIAAFPFVTGGLTTSFTSAAFLKVATPPKETSPPSAITRSASSDSEMKQWNTARTRPE